MNTFTDHDIALTAARKYDIEYQAAADALDTYIGQIEKNDGREIDRESIGEEDVDFLLHSIGEALSAGDIGQRELFDLEDAAVVHTNAQRAAEDAKATRDATIVRAVKAGASKSAVGRAAGISRQAVQQIIDKR